MNTKKPITIEDVIKAIEQIKLHRFGRVEAVIGEGRIVEVNVQRKIKETET